MATYRSLDPSMGRWLQVDPKAEMAGFDQSPYSWPMNNPITYNDPNGDIAPLIAIGAAVIGGGINVYRNWDNIKSFGDGAAAFGIGGLGGLAAVFTGGWGAGLISTGATLSATTVIASGTMAGITAAGADAFVTETGNAFYFGDASFGEALGNGLLSMPSAMLMGGAAGAGISSLGVAAGSFTKGHITEIVENTSKGAPWGFAESGSNVIRTPIYGVASSGTSVVSNTASKVSQTRALANYYPPNGGAMGSWQNEVLQEGTKISRYGSEYGNYFSPLNTPLQMRALPSSNTGPLRAYEVTKALPVRSSTIAPAFGKVGTGIQYQTYGNAKILKQLGYLKPIK